MTKINKDSWEVKKLGEVTTFSRGLTYSGNDEVPASSNVVLRSNNITLESQSLNLDELKYINDSIVIPAEKKLAKDTIFMCMSNGSMKHIGKVAYIDKDYDYAFGGFMGLMRPKAEVVFPKYLYFYFCSQEFKRVLTKIANGANINNIKFSDINQERIPLPPLPIQQRIVEELDEINAIISAKKQQIKELDELAQSIFYNMFGDPVSNEMGWEVKELRNNVEEMFLGPFGSALKVDSYVPESESYAMVYEQKHAIQGTLHLDNHFISEEKFNSLARFEVKGGDFIMSCRGTIGKIYQLPSNAPRGIIHPSLMKIRILPEAYAATFFIFMLKNVIELQQTKGNCVQMAITAKELGAKNLPLPPLPLQETFAARIAAIEEEKAAITASIDEMQTLLNARMQEYFG